MKMRLPAMDGLTPRDFTGHMKCSPDKDTTTLVLGGTGKTGRRLAQRLAAHGLPRRIGSRSGDPPFDWDDRRTWTPALRDIGSVYLSYYPDLAVAGSASTVRSFVELALEQGVRRVVLLSGRGEDGARLSEDAVRNSGAEWTILRSSWFNQNFSESYFLESLVVGELALPAGDIPEPFVDADDIADVAYTVLTEDGHAGQLYELSGPRLLTFAQAVAEIARAADREIRYVHVSIDEFASGLAEHGVPPAFVSLLTYLFENVLDGRNAHLTDGVQRTLGRTPRDFSDYARHTAATGVWNRVRAPM
jgi:uncharacterized protein YbjT (DUF2867 family)